MARRILSAEYKAIRGDLYVTGKPGALKLGQPGNSAFAERVSDTRMLRKNQEMGDRQAEA